ncbi:MAG: DNA polymerase IV [Wenzhouxiangellaceae bacterium]
MSLRSFFIDFDSYFASVEQHLRPHLRGRPVAVVPVRAETTSCIAASYEAKACGVSTGTSVRDARRLCPGIELVEARHKEYIEFHHRLVAAIDSCIPVDTVLSIDEMRCSLTGSWQDERKARRVASQVREAVAAVGTMTCSIGIAPNPFLAKVASKMEKPNGLTVIRQEDLPHALNGLALGDLHGIGRRMLTRLQRQGVRSVGDLYAADRGTLRRVWGGIEGERLYDELRGRLVYRPPTKRASIGHSHVLPPDLRRDDKALAVLHRLLQKAAWRLRHLGYHAGGLHLHLRYRGQGDWHAQRDIAATGDTRKLLQVLTEQWAERPRGRTLLAVGVTLNHLLPQSLQTEDLFADHREQRSLNQVVDRLNVRYGSNTVYFGGAHRARGAAPMRIAFTQIPNPQTEQ